MPLNKDIGNIVDGLLSAFDKQLNDMLEDSLASTYKAGGDEMAEWANKNLPRITKEAIGDASEFEGPPMEEAIKWAEKHGAQLVTQMDEETKRRLAKIISDGIKNKRGIPGISRDLRKAFKDMSKYRSQLIARTETRKALFHASHDNMVDMGIDGKEWVLGSAGSCEDCQSNAAVGVIPVNDDFPIPEGDIHPGCTCAIAPAILKK